MEIITLQDVFDRKKGREQELLEIATETTDVALDDWVRVDLVDYLADPSAGQPSAAKDALAWIDARVADANAEVSGHVSPRYGDVAAADLPAVVKTLTTDVAVYRIFGGDGESEEHRAYQAAIRFLGSVAAGRVDLDVPATAGNDRAVAQVSGGQREFGDDDWAGY